MDTRPIVGCLLATALIASAHAVLPTLTLQAVRSLTRTDQASGTNCPDVPTVECATFSAMTFEDPDGTPNAAISVFFQAPGTSSVISCEGPDSVELSLSPNGITSIVATLDPSSPGCTSEGVSMPVSVNLAGQPNGESHLVDRGVRTEETPSGTVKVNFFGESWSETFNGTIGSVEGPFGGSAIHFRTNRRERVR